MITLDEIRGVPSTRASGPACTICADASPAIGYGHVRRTLAVGLALQARGYGVRYAMRPGSDDRMPMRAGLPVTTLRSSSLDGVLDLHRPGDGPLIVDSYRATVGELSRLRAAGACVVVFDDDARLPRYPADVVIDAAPGAHDAGYRGEPDTHFLLGPAWRALGPEFTQVIDCSPHPVPTLLITCGGSDPDDVTNRVLAALSGSLSNWRVVALVGPGYRGDLASLRRHLPSLVVHQDPANVAETLAEAELAVSSAGVTAWELAALGVPTVLLELSDDQRPGARALAQAGAAISLGPAAGVADARMRATVAELAADPGRREEMGRAGRQLIDGRGGVRVADRIADRWRERSKVEHGEAARTITPAGLVTL